MTCSTISWRDSSWLPTNALQTEAMCLLACLWISAPRCLRLHSVFFTLSPSSASCLPHLALRLSVLLIPVLLWNQVLLLCFLICLIFTLSLHCLRRCHCSFWEFLLSYPLFLSFLLPALCWDPAAIMMMRDSVLPGSREWGEANADKPCIITPKEMTLTSLTLKFKLQVNTTNFTLRVL